MTERGEAHPISQISALLDGELAESERAAIEAHVAACSSCRVLLDDYRVMAEAAMREEPPPVPADLRSRIHRTIAAAGSADVVSPWRRIVYQRLGLAAAAGIVLVIGLWTTRWEDVPPTPTPIGGSAAPDATGSADRAENKEKMDQPAAPADRDMVDHLRALGYVGSGTPPKSEPAPPATGGKTFERQVRPSPPPPPADPGSARGQDNLRKKSAVEKGFLDARSPASGPAAARVAEPETARKDIAEGLKGSASMQAVPRSAQVQPPEGGSSGQVLLFQYESFQVSAQEDGTVVLSTEGYTCAVRQEGEPVDRDITALFALATTTRAAPGAPARPGAAVVRLLRAGPGPESAAGRIPGEDLSGPRGTAIETRFRALLRDRYLPLMNGRCGAVPHIVPAP